MKSREYLTLDELVRAMAVITDRNLSTTVKIHSYRTHTGDPFPTGGKAEWNGPLAHEIRCEVAVTENYVAWAEIEALMTDLRAVGFEGYFTPGGYEDGYLHVGVGRQGHERVLTESPCVALVRALTDDRWVDDLPMAVREALDPFLPTADDVRGILADPYEPDSAG